ncbi:MAG: enoyl-CoA hydratase-related protein [Acidimicrobiales bacterium]
MSPDDATGAIRTELIDDHILTIQIDRPAKLNGFTPEMLDQMVDAFTRLDEDPTCGPGWCTPTATTSPQGSISPLRGRMKGVSGPRTGTVWSTPRASGGPAGSPRVRGEGDHLHDRDRADARRRHRRGRRHLSLPTARAARGIHATGGATIRFVERGGWGNAMYHLLTSDEFDAAEAHRIGLVQEITAAERRLRTRRRAGSSRLRRRRRPCEATKASSRRFVLEGEAAAVAAFAATQASLAATDDFREGLQSFIERRPPRFTRR